MKKKTLSILAFSAVFAFATLTSCGGEKHEEETTHEEVTENHEEVVDEAVETVVTEVSPEVTKGEELFTSNACVACHQVENKLVGPALKDIAAGYSDNEEGLTAFLKGEGEAIIDPAQAAVMAPQIEITKNMSDDDRNSITAYIMSNK
jgi:cytochrome c